MLDITYGDDVPPAFLDCIEHHARRLGLPLADVEDAATSLDAAEAFILAAEEGFPAEARVDLALEAPRRLA